MNSAWFMMYGSSVQNRWDAFWAGRAVKSSLTPSKCNCDTSLIPKKHMDVWGDVGCTGFVCFTYSDSVRIIRTGRNRKITEKYGIRTLITRKYQVTISSNHFLISHHSMSTFESRYPSYSDPNWFFSRFEMFMTTYGRNRRVGGPKIHRSDPKTPGIDVFYSTWAGDQILYKNIEKQKVRA